MGESNSILKTKIIIQDKEKAAFADWQAELNAAIANYPGFVSLEILSPVDLIQPEWLINQRFESNAQLLQWKNSDSYQQLIFKLKPLLIKKKGALTEVEIDLLNMQGGITEVIITEIDPSKELLFRDWIAKIHQIEAKFPGFRGTYVQSPATSQGKNWITLLQFDTLANLETWLKSKERLDILQESTALITSLEIHRVVTSYAGWFSSLLKGEQAPPVWKQTLIVLLVLFPIVMLEMKYLSPLLTDLPTSVSVFLGNALSVTLIAWPMMPGALIFLGWWCRKPISKQKNWWGILLLCGLYCLEILLFMFLS